MNSLAAAAACHGFRKDFFAPGISSSSSSRLRFKLQNNPWLQKKMWLKMRCPGCIQGSQGFDSKPLVISSSSEQKQSRKSMLRRLRARVRLWSHLIKRFVAQLSLVSFFKILRKNSRRAVAGGVLACLFAAGSFFVRLSAAYAPKVVPYSALIQSLEAQQVRSVLFEEGSSQIFFNKYPEQAPDSSSTQQLQEADEDQSSSMQVVESSPKAAAKSWEYCTRKIRHDEAYLLGLLRNGAGKVEYSSAPRSLSSVAVAIVGTILTLWIPISPLLWLMHRQISGKGDALKKRKKTLHVVKFDDVAGVDTARAELWEIVSCLKGHSNFRSLGAKFPKGVLLVGPPGTGKTLLARALAGEAGVPFFAASASEFVEMFVGRGAARIRELFAAARKYAPSVIFIDELDAVGGQRGRGFNDERDQTLNQLLTEMDGFESETGVLVLAATNRAEALDPALCRAGRFSRKVYVKEPDLEGRKQVLAVHMRGVRVESDPKLIQEFVASITPGFVGADLANVVNEAALLAARKGQSAVTLEDFKEAVYRSKYGVGQDPSFLANLERKMCAVLQSVGAVPGHNKVNASYPAMM